MTRVTDCTPQKIKEFAEAIEHGMPLCYVFDLTGVAQPTYQLWMDKGEKGEEPYLSFMIAVKEAEPKFIRSNLDVIKRASQKEWAAGAWLLERRSASNFSRNQTRIKLKQSSPDLSTVDKLMDMVNQIIDQVARGEMSVEDAKAATAAIEEQRKVAETIQVKERIDQIEAKVKAASK